MTALPSQPDAPPEKPGGELSPALLVDLYELTMAHAYWLSGMADRPATFSLFSRSLPRNRGYLVAAGLDDCLTWLEGLNFGPSELEQLSTLQIFPDPFLDWLGQLRFTGSVRAVAEGTLLFPDEPILEVDGPMAVAQMAETYLLNQVTMQTTLATKASRCHQAAAGRPVSDFGLRHAQGIDSGMKVARVCRLVGIESTSNVAGALRYGLAASGTMAHSFVQAHGDELSAMRHVAEVMGPRTVLLVDTYDSERGIAAAVQVAREARDRGVLISGLRLDSGNLAELSARARAQLDGAGLQEVKIVATGGLDEYQIDRLVQVDRAPIDSFGIGSAMVVSADAPLTDTVYKLAQYDGRPVRKTSTGKRTLPGPKQIWRREDFGEDVLSLEGEPAPSPDFQPLLATVMLSGVRTEAGTRSLADANRRYRDQISRLRPEYRLVVEPSSYPVRVSPRLESLVREMDSRPTAG